MAILLAASNAWSATGETVCKISLDDCHATGSGPSIGVTIDPNLDEEECEGAAQEYYDICDLGDNPAPANIYPRRVKTEFIGNGSTDDDVTVGRWLYPEGLTLPLRGEPILGAIRFDHYYGANTSQSHCASSTGTTSSQWPCRLKYSASGADWQARLPFYTKISGSGVTVPHSTGITPSTIDFPSDLQSVMNQEIDYASRGGLDYWAFVWWDRQSGSGVAEPGLPRPDGSVANSPYHPLDPAVHWKNSVAHDRSLQLYLTSHIRERINFALIIPINRFGSFPGGSSMGGQLNWPDVLTDANFYSRLTDGINSSWFETSVEQWVELAKENTYQKVMGDRPLLFLYNVQGLTFWFQGTDPIFRAREAIRYIRKRFTDSGLGNPYIVGMTPSPQCHSTNLDHPCNPNQSGWLPRYFVDEFGLDAASRYSRGLDFTTNGAQPPCVSANEVTMGTSGGVNYSIYEGSPYADPDCGLAWREQQWLDTTGTDAGGDNKIVVAPMMTGWDSRPLLVPTDITNPPAGSFENYVWATHASAEEIAERLEVTQETVRSDEERNEANAVLIYAWNELTEGGWLVPTFGDGNDRLTETRATVCAPADPGNPPPAGTCRSAPEGHVGFVGGGIATGWAYDPDKPDRSIRVDFYANAPYGSGGTPIGSVYADEINEGDNEELGIAGNHRFYFPIEKEFYGVQIYAYAVDPVIGSLNSQLSHYGSSYFVHPTECQDGIDNDDSDSLVDTNDPGCTNQSDVTEEPNCSDGVDNDHDGKVDYTATHLNGDSDTTDREYPPDPNCGTWGFGYEGDTPASNCNDGLDNDGDGLADTEGVDLNSDDDFGDAEHPADNGCSSATDTTEGSSCGLGFEAAIPLVLLALVSRRVVRGRRA